MYHSSSSPLSDYNPAAVGSHGTGYRDIFIDGFVPPSTSVAPMFPFYENTTEWDDFGEVINPDDYVTKDDDMDQAAMHVSVGCKTLASLIVIFVLYVSNFLHYLFHFLHIIRYVFWFRFKKKKNLPYMNY